MGDRSDHGSECFGGCEEIKIKRQRVEDYETTTCSHSPSKPICTSPKDLDLDTQAPPKSNNSVGSSEEGCTSGGSSGGSSGYANGVSDGTSSNGSSSNGNGQNHTRKDTKTYRAYHSEIEKRRRNKINNMIDELTDLVPLCNSVSHKLDKLTVLRLTVQHLKMLTQKTILESSSVFKPPCMKEEEMKYMIEQATDSFLFVLSSDRAQVLYISDAIGDMLHYSPSELVGRSFYDIVHSKDIPRIKEQLAPFACLPSIKSCTKTAESDTDTTGVVGCMPGSRRSFHCRFRTMNKNRQDPEAKLSVENRVKRGPYVLQELEKSYAIVHCTGFLKSWQTADREKAHCGIDDDVELSTFCCFVGTGRRVKTLAEIENIFEQPAETIPLQFTSRHSAEGKYLWVDPRITPTTGYFREDLLGQIKFGFVHEDDVESLKRSHRKVLLRKHQERITSEIYRMKGKNGGLIPMQTVLFSLFNPFTKELEYVVHQNSVVDNYIPPERREKLAAIKQGEPEAVNVNGSPEALKVTKNLTDSRVDAIYHVRNPEDELAPTKAKRQRHSSPLTVGAGDIGRTEDSESSQENVGELNSTTIALSPVTADLLQHGIININVAAFSQLLGNAGENKVLSLTGSSRRGSGSGTGSGSFFGLPEYFISSAVTVPDQPISKPESFTIGSPHPTTYTPRGPEHLTQVKNNSSLYLVNTSDPLPLISSAPMKRKKSASAGKRYSPFCDGCTSESDIDDHNDQTYSHCNGRSSASSDNGYKSGSACSMRLDNNPTTSKQQYSEEKTGFFTDQVVSGKKVFGIPGSFPPAHQLKDEENANA